MKNNNNSNQNTKPYEKKKKSFYKPLSQVKKSKMQIALIFCFAFLGVLFSFCFHIIAGLSITAISILLVYVIKCPVDMEKTMIDLKKVEEKANEKKKDK